MFHVVKHLQFDRYNNAARFHLLVARKVKTRIVDEENDDSMRYLPHWRLRLLDMANIEDFVRWLG